MDNFQQQYIVSINGQEKTMPSFVVHVQHGLGGGLR